jgi:hypothetical protein
MKQHWFIGWDEREVQAFDVARFSLKRHASCDVIVEPLKHRQLRRANLFWREWRMDATGQWWDDQDGKPFSTEFAFTRFLTVTLARKAGLHGWAFFCDCDFLFCDDVAKLEPLLDPSYAVMCVKHHFRPLRKLKMDGQIQARYPRKNWSSLIAFNIDHRANNCLTAELVNMEPGSWLHGFGWLPFDLIGELPERWNRLVGHFSGEFSALHYTDGGPWLDDWRGGPMDDPWLVEMVLMHRDGTTRRLEFANDELG